MEYTIRVYTVNEVTEMADTWANYHGFSGETCGNCKKTANVLAGGPGWICPCQHFNVQSLHGGPTIHETPDYGPSRAVIVQGHKNSKKYQAFLKL